MIKGPARVLKSDDVTLQGQFHLDVAQSNSKTAKKPNMLSTPQARVTENHPDFALIEITCSCGARMFLRCEYAGEKSVEEKTNQIQ